MKRASFTLFQPQRWMSLGLSTLMVLFVWCCLGINTAQAQVEMPTDATPVTVDFSAADCDAGTVMTFTDDGGAAGNYDDSGVRADTITFCPSDAWHRMYIEFTKFDLEDNDTLHVFDGNHAAVVADPDAVRIGSGSGVGVSQINGGWVRSNCDPTVNPTGCLTFVFATDGTNSKGFGWEANALCEDRTAELTIGNIVSPKITCDSITINREASADVVFNAPAVTFCDAATLTDQDSVLVTVTNQRGETCFSEILTAAGVNSSVTQAFGVGAYSVNYTLLADTHESKQENRTFSVQGPSLICNDNIEVPFGSACAIQLTPDDILENPCDTIDGVLEYDITIVIGEGKNAVTIPTDANGYPVVTTDHIAAAGMTVCNGTATVTIVRTITPPSTLGAGCHNGPQNASCSTILTFNDQSIPFITLGAGVDTLIACGSDEAALGALVLATASAIDNCDDDVTVAVKSVEIRETDPCMANDGNEDERNETTAIITISATDDCGNEGTITDTLTIIRPNLYDHLVKVDDTSLECNDITTTEVPGLEVGTVSDGVFTATDTVNLSLNEYICGYRLSFRDVEIPGTDCGRKTYKYWSVVDWCDASTGPTVVDTSFIEFTDSEAPIFVGEESDQVMAPTDIPLGPFACTFDINGFDVPSAVDSCGLDEVVLHRVFRIEDGGDWEIDRADWAALDCDSFRLMFVARDQCHEQRLEDTTRQIVVIRDVTNPSAICTDELNVSVASNEGSRLSVDDIDAGSYDACVTLTREIRKENADGTYTPWGQTVDIVCQDVHRKPRVELRITDKQGNENTCWMFVNAEDKIAPVCNSLPDSTFICSDFHTGELGAATGEDFVDISGTDLADLYDGKFGDPFAPGNCFDNLACGELTESQSYRLTELNCGQLLIERRFSVTDWSGRESNIGTQRIDVNYEANWSLTLPADVSQGCDDGGFPAAWTATEIIGNGSCDLWALEVSEKTFDVPGDICMKIERTYELINWCVYQAGTDAESIPREADGGTQIILSEGREDVGRFTYVQVLKLYANDAPTITIAEVDTCLVGEGDLEPFGMADNSPGEAPFECDEERTFSASGMNCAGRALTSDHYTWIFTDLNLPDGHVDRVSRGTDSSFTKVVSPNMSYTVEFWVSDGCGNSSGAVKEYQFWDCKKPTPYVLHGLAIEMMQTGSIQLWANDLNQGSYDNCTVQNQLRYRLFEGDPIDGPQNLTDILALEENITFTCLTTGLRNISFYVIDEKGNWDVVATYVSVQANNGACPGGDPIENGVIAGKITNAQGDKIELVNVSVNGGDNTMATGATGEFQFDLALEGDYTITPEKNINPLNGVSTYDLVLISKHILGLESFDSPYKYIAADVNKSGTITAFDMVQLRQLILNINSEFSNNSSWRFVDAKHEFTSENPAGENFDEFMNINNLDGEMLDVDFIATKIGDVNGNARSNSLQAAESRTTNGTLSLNVMDRFVEAGQTVTVDFTTADITATQGYQFTMNFAGLDLVELNEGVAKAANFNTTLAKRGVLTTSWNGEATDENLFSLTFTATTNGLLSELVSVSSELTTAEAYNTAGELLDVELNFNASNVSAAFELNQNTPNPFNGQTLIGFNLPQAGMATLKVMDVQGKVLTVISQEGVKGYNQVTLNAKSLEATGVLYYQLESADNIATKKMIIID